MKTTYIHQALAGLQDRQQDRNARRLEDARRQRKDPRRGVWRPTSARAAMRRAEAVLRQAALKRKAAAA